MSWWRSDELYEGVGSYNPDFAGEEWKMGVGPRKANFGHSVMGTGGAIHFDHRGNQLPTYRHTPRLLNLMNMANKDVETVTQRDVDEYRRNRDSGKNTGWIERGIKGAVSDHFNLAKEEGPGEQAREARMVSGGEPLGGTFTGFVDAWRYRRYGYGPNSEE